jgi:alpha-glucosidase
LCTQISAFAGSAWKWSEERQEFYLHQFTVEQPDLNYRNPLVIEEMQARTYLYHIILV